MKASASVSPWFIVGFLLCFPVIFVIGSGNRGVLYWLCFALAAIGVMMVINAVRLDTANQPN